MAHATLLLACNGCGARRQGQRGESYDVIRDRLATVGWLSNKARDLDLCPACVAGRNPSWTESENTP